MNEPKTIEISVTEHVKQTINSKFVKGASVPKNVNEYIVTMGLTPSESCFILAGYNAALFELTLYIQELEKQMEEARKEIEANSKTEPKTKEKN